MSDLVTRLRRWTHDANAVPAGDLMDEAAAEIDRLRLTDAEREAIGKVLRRVREDYFAGRFADSVKIAAVIDGLLERTK